MVASRSAGLGFRLDRSGHNSKTCVFGVAERFPESAVDAELEAENPAKTEPCFRELSRETPSTGKGGSNWAQAADGNSIFPVGVEKKCWTWSLENRPSSGWFSGRSAVGKRGCLRGGKGREPTFSGQLARDMDACQSRWAAYEMPRGDQRLTWSARQNGGHRRLNPRRPPRRTSERPGALHPWGALCPQGAL